MRRTYELPLIITSADCDLIPDTFDHSWGPGQNSDPGGAQRDTPEILLWKNGHDELCAAQMEPGAARPILLHDPEHRHAASRTGRGPWRVRTSGDVAFGEALRIASGLFDSPEFLTVEGPLAEGAEPVLIPLHASCVPPPPAVSRTPVPHGPDSELRTAEIRLEMRPYTPCYLPGGRPVSEMLSGEEREAP